MSNQITPFSKLEDLAIHLRTSLESKNHALLFAHNGVGKTRLSMAFKEAIDNSKKRDTLYFNAFTEDLFSWDNDLEHNQNPVLKINKNSRFVAGLEEMDMDNRIRPLISRYAHFHFRITYDDWTVSFFENEDPKAPPIKISRGEENTFIWCFFLAIAQLAIDKQEPYEWVKYLYIDDPISSLDDNNAIVVAADLARLLLGKDNAVKTVISSHHALFFNVMWNELNKKPKPLSYFLSHEEPSDRYLLRETGDTPFFHHVALLQQIHEAAESGKLYTYHFNILRSILEKTATFHGFERFSACITSNDSGLDDSVHTRMLNLLSHGNYSLFEPKEMVEENKQHFKKILNGFIENYHFNPKLFQTHTEKDNQK